jgi:hypothetical protein
MAGRPRYPAGPAVGVRRKEPPWKGPWGPDAFGPAPRAELLHVLMLPDLERASGSESSGAIRSADDVPRDRRAHPKRRWR